MGDLRLHPFDLLLRMSIACAVQCALYGWWSGELAEAVAYVQRHENPFAMKGALLFNATLAFCMSFVSFYSNRATSTLSVAVVGNVKQIFLIGFALMLFKDEFDLVKAVGVVLTIVGGFVVSGA